MTITLGGETVTLIFPGRNHADDGTLVFFPAERVVFSTDFPADALVTTSMRSFPSGCGDFDQSPISEWIKSYHTIEALDFDILAEGHGKCCSRNQMSRKGANISNICAIRFAAGMKAGKSLDELRRTLMLEEIQGLGQLHICCERPISRPPIGI